MVQNTAQQAADSLQAHFRRRRMLANAAGILSWDQQTLMPVAASQMRGEVLAELACLSHELLLDSHIEDWVADSEELEDPTGFWQANLREIRRQYQRAKALPAALVAARTRAASAGEMAWREARKQSDFALLKPALEKIVALEQEAAAALGGALDLGLYDALLDGYEPGARISQISEAFDQIAAFVPPLRAQALAQSANTPKLQGPFPIERQEALGRKMMAALGFDFNRGRLDVSLHPFCGGADDDVRITTRYNPEDFASSLMGVLHETGHALYELGLPAAWRDQPVGRARGMVLHESQSLMIEMQLCRSMDFFTFATPHFVEAFGADPEEPAWQAEAFAARATAVHNGFIRVDADELSYPLHVILRTRLEKALIEGDLVVADLPTAWNEAYQALFDTTPPNDAQGCLQDVHWPSGAFGYFPTYTLGAMAAAQIFAAAKQNLPELSAQVREGDFAPLLAWVGKHIHEQASMGSTDDILMAATGSVLNSRAYLGHLQARYRR